jgi:hypothetical protein
MRRAMVSLLVVAALCAACTDEESEPDRQEAGTSRGTPTTAVPRPPVDGDPAVWVVDPQDPPTEGSDEFTALVSRMACSGGETGDVLPPTVEIEETRIVISFTVAPIGEGNWTCQGNPPVPYVVHLEEPVGERELIDAGCQAGGAGVSTAFCVGPNRWAP